VKIHHSGKCAADYPEGMTARNEEPARADAIRNRAALLDAAADVLAVEPTASLAEVAARAGLGRATLYRHFQSREALRAAIREEALARATAALEAADLGGCSAREGVRRAASVLVPLGMRFRILLAEGADTDPEFLEARDRALSPLWDVIGRGLANGELEPTVEPAWAAMTLGGLLVTAVRAASAGVIAADQAGEIVARTLFEGLGVR
jgi:TetR/AcrR family transcriptional regulator, mexCD-oprJ operon repressor